MQYFADIYLEYDLCLRRFGDLDLLRLRSEKKTIKVKKKYRETKKGLHITVKCFILAIYQHCILNLARILSQLLEWLFNNYPLSLNGLRVTIATEAKGQMGYGLRGHEDEGNNCLTKIQLVGQKYRDKTTLAS